MKLTLLLFSLFFTSKLMASDIITPQELLEYVKNHEFKSIGKAKVYGFHSTESCLSIHGEVLLVRNYCNDTKKYPAKGYYIISPKWGLHYLYEEILPGDIYARDVNLDSFPETVSAYWEGEELDLNSALRLLEYLGKDYGPGCWVTNYSRYTDSPQSECFQADINLYPHWKTESEKMVNDIPLWNSSLDMLKEKTQL